ncbi:MAG: HNH endonuclease [Pelagibacterales bacterium]|nr:HNH endonuclease [Pelagibacterales bacterium]
MFRNFKTYSSRSYSRYSGRSGSYGRNSYKSTHSSSKPYTSRSYRRQSNKLTTRTHNGYSQFYDKNKGGCQFTHRRVAEKKLGRQIRPGYEVHHINHNKRDNRPQNLAVITRSQHRAIHQNKIRKFFNNLFKK